VRLNMGCKGRLGKGQKKAGSKEPAFLMMGKKYQ
jgi:hypothetical protein